MGIEEKLPKIKFNECKHGQFIMSLDTTVIFEIIRSIEALPAAKKIGDEWNEGTFAPSACVMRCYWSSPRRVSQFKKGDITIDYFNHYFYGPYVKKDMDSLIEMLKESYKK